jgi:hypothetical protein
VSAAVRDLATRWADELRAEGDQAPRVDPRDDSWMYEDPDEMPPRPDDTADDLRGATHDMPPPLVEGRLMTATKTREFAQATPYAVHSLDEAPAQPRSAVVQGIGLDESVGRRLGRRAQRRQDCARRGWRLAHRGQCTRTADRVVRMMPDLAKRFRQMIAALPRTDLPPDELTRARGLIHRFLGGRATVEKDARGRIFARLKLDGRPLLGPTAVNTVSLSTDSLQMIPGTWFTHFRIWGSAPRCPGKSVSRWMNASAS